MIHEPKYQATEERGNSWAFADEQSSRGSLNKGKSKSVPAHERFLERIADANKVLDFSNNGKIFAQGDVADAIFYVEKGKVKLTVVSEHGKEAIVAIFGAGEFFGEQCLAGQDLRMATAAALGGCSVLKIGKNAMQRALQKNDELSKAFVAHLIARSIRYQEDLIDQLFNSSEKRLARALILMAQFEKGNASQVEIPEVSQETLAKIVGATRVRINFFMNKFRKLGFIEYNSHGGLRIHRSLLNVVLHD